MESNSEEWENLAVQNTGGITGLQTSRCSERLNQIDRVRAKGVGDHISLPQIVVCGDQSAGKSSVLEGITGIPFPREDGLCTRFATEIILRHQPGRNTITATILPSKHRSVDEQLKMQSFKRQLSSFDELPLIILEASVLMGVRGKDSDPSACLVTFAADVLRLEVVGQTGLHLTVVDLPGLISVSDDADDINIVEGLVDDYMRSSRTIILAVVQANNDIDTQKIIQRARTFDGAGERTVGIITKPDLINLGTEHRIADLVKNLDNIKLRLGFFLLKNPSPVQLRSGITWEQRNQLEADFFKASPWKEQSMDSSRIGIENLRTFLQDLLENHIERELPKVRKEVQELMMNVQRELDQIGPERSSVEQIRTYLIHLSLEFFNLTNAALDGNYDGRDAAFFNMAMNSSRLSTAQDIFDLWEDNLKPEQSQHLKHMSGGGQMSVSREEMLDWILKVYHNTRGRELPGNYNPALLSELYHEQSGRWSEIARQHVREINDLVRKFVGEALTHTVADEQVRRSIRSRTQLILEKNYQQAMKELEIILLDEQGPPITYNHYYTDNIQNAREQALKKGLGKAITDDFNGKLHVSNTSGDIQKLVGVLRKRVIEDMSQQACSEALTALDAYYKVAMKTFVDNVCRQVIERHILRRVVDIFSPTGASQFPEADLMKIASENAHVRNRRIELGALKRALEESGRELEE